MELKLKNIGKLKEADIKIDGITVIAGKNNTGKSTVGKSLYCIFSSLYNVNKKIETDRKEYIRREIGILFRRNSFFMYSAIYDNYINIFNSIIDKITENNFDEAKKLLLSIFDNIKEKTNKEQVLRKFEIPSDNDINNTFNNIKKALQIPSEYFYIHRLENIFNEEFKGQINNINQQISSTINLLIQNNNFNIEISNDKFECDTYMELQSDIVYIDSPFVLDNIGDVDCNELNHRCSIVTKLKENIKDDNMIADIILQEKISYVTKKLDEVGVGKLIQDNEIFKNSFRYKTLQDKEPIEIVNISAGLKTFIILKTLILNGHIKEKSCIILDEPEVHLHPEWQLVFAELIVLLQKTFNLHILLNTHSPYFLRAIQVYSTKYQADRCNYYLAENSNGLSYIRNVNNDVNEIYKLLYAPFQQLDDEPYYDN